jgi:hypothetical protein
MFTNPDVEGAGMAETTTQEAPLDELDIFVGEWIMALSFARDPGDAPRGRTSFEWLAGRRFLVQRWEVEHPDTPGGIAIIGSDGTGAGYLQHYFDSRGLTYTRTQ